MTSYLTPGVYMEEKSSGSKPIEGVGTSVAAFIGVTEKGPVGKATFISNFAEFVKIFGGPIPILKGTQEHYLYYAVRHFFTEGGSMCYIVRIMHYTDESNTGVAASKIFDGITIKDFTTVPVVPPVPALKVFALNEGKWGDNLEVQVENSAKFSLRLSKSITGASDLKEIDLVNNTDVQIGDLLWIVEEIIGVVKSVSTVNQITFASPLKEEDITADMKVFSSDFKLITSTTSSLKVENGSTSITLEKVNKMDGTTLKNGDLINFLKKEAMVVVKKISQKQDSNETVMVVEFEPQDFSSKNFLKDNSRVYAMGFDIIVRDKNSKAILETHENLSLISTNMKDYVNERLSIESGNSFYIKAEREGNTAVLPNNTSFEALSGGINGIDGIIDADYIGSESSHTGLYALDTIKDASILVIPNSSLVVTKAAITYCEKRQDLFFIMDSPNASIDDLETFRKELSSSYAAIYYPWIKISDPFADKPLTVPPSGAVAGIYADTDAKRGVHKAPAGIENGYINAASGIERIITKGENDKLYQEGVNVIRKLPEGIVVWGARTLSADPEWKYINIRRLFIFLEQSIERGTQWTVFEPNDPSLWKSIIRNISAFLKIQWLEGKLVGEKQEQAFYVKCDEETNPQEVVDAGQVITEIGVAPSKPAEFVVFRIRQFARGAAGA